MESTGSAAGFAITLVTIFFLSLKPEVYQPPIAIIAAIGAGVVLGFLFQYVSGTHPGRAQSVRCFSVFSCGLAIIAGTKIATALLVLSLPIADALFVIWQRLRDGVPITQSDKRHLHYRLMELGWSERRITWFFIGVTACIALIALNTQALGKLVALLLILGIIFFLLFFVERQTRMKGIKRGEQEKGRDPWYGRYGTKIAHFQENQPSALWRGALVVLGVGILLFSERRRTPLFSANDEQSPRPSFPMVYRNAKYVLEIAATEIDRERSGWTGAFVYGMRMLFISKTRSVCVLDERYAFPWISYGFRVRRSFSSLGMSA
jgi:hypothetical protein